MKTAVLVACLVFSGCSLFEDSHELVVSTEITPESLSRGETAAVKIVVTNAAEESRTITVNTCPEPFRVIDRLGEIVGPPGGVCTAELRQRTLAPGESFTFDRRWAGEGRSPATMLPPGRYRIVGYPAAGADSRPASVMIH